MSLFRKFNLSAGNFFFKYRNALFPVFYLVLFLLAKPHYLFKNHLFDKLVASLGLSMALLGQAIRLITIGYDYIERGGRQGKVYASFLVRKGVYALVRNPMYIGNILMAIGLTIFSAASTAMIIGIPLFIFIYQAIIAAEEHYLTNKFGDDYRDYCSRVNRIIPRFKEFSPVFRGLKYDWKKSLRKEFGTVFFLILSLLLIHTWRDVNLFGFELFRKRHVPLYPELLILALMGYLLIRILKKKGSLASPSQ